MIESEASHEVKILHENKTSSLEILELASDTELPCNQVKNGETWFWKKFASGFQSYSASYLNQGKDCYNPLHYLVQGKPTTKNLFITLKGLDDLNTKLKCEHNEERELSRSLEKTWFDWLGSKRNGG